MVHFAVYVAEKRKNKTNAAVEYRFNVGGQTAKYKLTYYDNLFGVWHLYCKITIAVFYYSFAGCFNPATKTAHTWFNGLAIAKNNIVFGVLQI